MPKKRKFEVTVLADVMERTSRVTVKARSKKQARKKALKKLVKQGDIRISLREK